MNPVVLPAISLALVLSIFLPVLLGVVNQIAQAANSGGAVGPWSIPARFGPYAVLVGSFLDGFIATETHYQWSLSAAAICYAVAAGLVGIGGGMVPGAVVHHFGGKVNFKRPPASVPSNGNGTKTNAVTTDPPKAAA